MGTSMLVDSAHIDDDQIRPRLDAGVARERLVEAIRACCDERANQDQLGERTSFSQSTASNYLAGKSIPGPLAINEIERACGRPDGWIAVRAGLVAEVKTVPEAIAMAPGLADDDRDALLDTYEALLDTGPAPPGDETLDGPEA